MVTKQIEVVNKLGLHARPATMLVKTASGFQSKVIIKKDELSVDAKSIMGIMAGGISQGTTVEIQAEGDDEAEAVDALVQLINDKFGE